MTPSLNKYRIRHSKYNAHRTVVNGISFASEKEGRRYCELDLAEKSGLISELVLQPRFKLVVNDQLICTYIADFQYKNADGNIITEDVKGFLTPVYKIKKKLMQAIYGIQIKEV